MDDAVNEDLNTKIVKDSNFWKGLIIPALLPFFSLICVILTIDMEIVDYPLLNMFFGGDDLFFYSLTALFFSLITWPFIGAKMPPPYHEGGKVSSIIALTVGVFLLFWVFALFSFIGGP